MAMKLTRAMIAAFIAEGDNGTSRGYLWGQPSGFGIRKSSGAAIYVFRYRAGGGRAAPRRELKLGPAVGKGSLTLDQAVKIAEDHVAAVRLGKDPAKDRDDRREAHAAAITVSDLAAAYVSAGAVSLGIKPRSLAFYDGILKLSVLPQIGKLHLSAVKDHHVRRIMDKCRAGGASASRVNAIARTIGAIWAWGRATGRLDQTAHSPALGIKLGREVKRERFLSSVELSRLGASLAALENEGRIHGDDAAAIRLLIFTGCRLREILNLDWRAVDLERGVLNLADSKTGAKGVVLAGPAIAILEALAVRGNSGAVFPARRGEAASRADLKGPWRLLTAAAELPALRIHDLRHSFASAGAASGMSLPILGKLLGHSQVSTTQRYAHLSDNPLRQAADQIAGGLAEAMSAQVRLRLVK